MSPRASSKRLDNPAHKLRKLMEKWDDRPTPEKPAFAERYRDNEFDVRVHLRLRGHAEQFCAIFQHHQLANSERRTCQGLQSVGHHLAGSDRIVDDTARCDVPRSTTEQEPMLVSNVHLMENPDVSFPSLVRLERTDCAYRTLAHSLYLSFELGFAFGATLALAATTARCRESVFATDFVPICDNECADKVIKSASEVVNSVAENAGYFWRDGQSMPDLKAICSILWIFLGDDFARIAIAKDVADLVQVEDMVIGPFDFNPGAV